MQEGPDLGYGDLVRLHRPLVIGGLIAALLAGCSGLGLDTYWRSERYVLIAVDARGQMHLAFDLANGTAIALVGPTVFSVGADEKHIVVKQHPSRSLFGEFDRSKTHYFIVARTASTDLREREKGVRGPLTEKEFEALKTTLALPPFSKTFADLQ